MSSWKLWTRIERSAYTNDRHKIEEEDAKRREEEEKKWREREREREKKQYQSICRFQFYIVPVSVNSTLFLRLSRVWLCAVCVCASLWHWFYLLSRIRRTFLSNASRTLIQFRFTIWLLFFSALPLQSLGKWNFGFGKYIIREWARQARTAWQWATQRNNEYYDGISKYLLNSLLHAWRVFIYFAIASKSKCLFSFYLFSFYLFNIRPSPQIRRWPGLCGEFPFNELSEHVATNCEIQSEICVQSGRQFVPLSCAHQSIDCIPSTFTASWSIVCVCVLYIFLPVVAHSGTHIRV